MSILAPISAGELVDKITILRVKAERIGDPAKEANVRKELALLEATARQHLPERKDRIVRPAIGGLRYRNTGVEPVAERNGIGRHLLSEAAQIYRSVIPKKVGRAGRDDAKLTTHLHVFGAGKLAMLDDEALVPNRNLAIDLGEDAEHLVDRPAASALHLQPQPGSRGAKQDVAEVLVGGELNSDPWPPLRTHIRFTH